MKSTLRTAAEVLILIGAILSTITSSITLLFTFWMIIPIIWFGAVITFTWVTRNQVLHHNSRSWIIFGIILSSFTNWVGLAGYICMLIENIQNEQTMPNIEDHKDDSYASQTTNPFTETSTPDNETEEIKFEDANNN